MKRLFFIATTILVMSLQALALDFQNFENDAFSISIPADWEIGFYGDDWMNAATEDNAINFNITFNEQGPTKAQLQEAVDNWVYMKERDGNKVDQKLVKEDYAMVRSILTDEDDGTQTVEVWYLLITDEPQGFSGSINSSFERANEAVDILVEMLATLKSK